MEKSISDSIHINWPKLEGIGKQSTLNTDSSLLYVYTQLGLSLTEIWKHIV